MVIKSDGTIEGLPKFCPKCGTTYSVVTLELHYSWGYGPSEGLCLTAKLRCLKCHPIKSGEWKDPNWIRKVHHEITTIDPDAINDALMFFRDYWKKLPQFRELTFKEKAGVT